MGGRACMFLSKSKKHAFTGVCSRIGRGGASGGGGGGGYGGHSRSTSGTAVATLKGLIEKADMVFQLAVPDMGIKRDIKGRGFELGTWWPGSQAAEGGGAEGDELPHSQTQETRHLN